MPQQQYPGPAGDDIDDAIAVATRTLATEPSTAGTGRYIDRFGPVPW